MTAFYFHCPAITVGLILGSSCPHLAHVEPFMDAQLCSTRIPGKCEGAAQIKGYYLQYAPFAAMSIMLSVA